MGGIAANTVAGSSDVPTSFLRALISRTTSWDCIQFPSRMSIHFMSYGLTWFLWHSAMGTAVNTLRSLIHCISSALACSTCLVSRPSPEMSSMYVGLSHSLPGSSGSSACGPASYAFSSCPSASNCFLNALNTAITSLGGYAAANAVRLLPLMLRINRMWRC